MKQQHKVSMGPNLNLWHTHCTAAEIPCHIITHWTYEPKAMSTLTGAVWNTHIQTYKLISLIPVTHSCETCIHLSARPPMWTTLTSTSAASAHKRTDLQRPDRHHFCSLTIGNYIWTSLNTMCTPLWKSIFHTWTHKTIEMLYTWVLP